MKKGFIYGVGQKDAFLKSALLSAESVKDYYPEAHITLCAPKKMVSYKCKQVFDNIICDDTVPDSVRTKLWALSHTPYDITMYLDADTICLSEEIQTAFDLLDQQQKDILFTRIRLYNSNRKGIIPHPEFKYHGGVFLYNRKCIPFMIEWWERWQRGQLEWEYNDFSSKLRCWDQFYLFYMITFTQHGLSIGEFPEDVRWNFVNGYFRAELRGKQEIIRHNTIKRNIYYDTN
jgi:hypothetical protein